MNYAGFWKRFAALFIDNLILMIPSLVLGGVVRDMYFAIGSGFIIAFIYFPFFESSALEATPGKALLGLSVVSESGARLTFRAAVIRFFCKYLSIVTIYIGYFMQLFTQKRQTLHDLFSESVVIVRPPVDMNYFKAWKEQIQGVVAKL